VSFKPYPKYKESGVEWLGRVPEHWEVTRLKHCVRLITAKAESRSNPLALENIEGWTGRLIPSEGDYQGEGTAFGSGDILFGKLRPYLAKVHLAERPGEAVGDFHVLRPESSLDGRFAQYGMLTREFIAIVDGSTYGSKMPRASWEFVGSMPMAVPPSIEQPGIATFLDHETAKIDALIAEQQRLIELLQEKRQAVISHAVTKGLNPDAPMKDSGIEWLGEVPEHWEIVQLRYLCRIQTGGRDTENAVEDGAYPFFVRSETVERINSYAADCEAVLTAGDGVGVGKVFHHYHGQFDFHQRVYMMNDFRSVTGRFLYHYLRTNFYKVALEGTAKSTVDSLRRPMFTGFPVAVPPSEEQASIVGKIQERAGQFDGLVAQATIAISLLQERRSALISAAVTGQIDVRGFTAGGSEAA
jgi:type I restriction enzyme S subunit